jgi:glycosyltransferase involved in cell wall biosynthesis
MMRVLHLPTTVGDPSGLSRQLRLLGIDSQVWSINQNYLDYPVDRVLVADHDGSFVGLLKLLRAGSYVFGRWDIIHFNFGSTLFSTWHTDAPRRGVARALAGMLNGVAAALQRLELGVLRARRIPIFVHYQGDDARQGDYSLQHFEISIATQVPPGYYTPNGDAWKRRQIALLGKRAAGIYAVNPDLMNVLPPPAVFLPYGHIAVQDWVPSYTQADRQRLVFAHAPTNREVKGTDLILEALAELADDGYRFDIDLIEGVSNADALARYRDADVVIDQLYAGWYGGLALEAMALGKPVVAYLRESDLHFLPPAMKEQLPLFRATPSTVKDDLKRILEMPRDELVVRAKQSRAYAERWHDSLATTSRIADDYRRALEAAKRRSGAR